MTVLDFRKGSSWGRALHASTFRQAKAERLFHRIRDRLQRAYRASIMVHYPSWPKIGDVVLWDANSGEVSAEIYKVEPCWNPSDMFTLFVRIRERK